MKRKQARKEIVQIQQGDVWIESAIIPQDATPEKKIVLAEGEGTHLHRFAAAAAVEVFIKDGIRYARVKKPVQVEHVTLDGRHGEHKPLTVPPGEYIFGQVYEHDYFAQMARTVVD